MNASTETPLIVRVTSDAGNRGGARGAVLPQVMR
jgi:hypothetical protein